VLVDGSRPVEMRRDGGRTEAKPRTLRAPAKRPGPSIRRRRTDTRETAHGAPPAAPDATPTEHTAELSTLLNSAPAVETEITGKVGRAEAERPGRATAKAPSPPPLPSAAAPHVRRRDVMLLVRELLERSDELFVYHIGVVAQAIVEDVIENLPAHAACVLVRDDDGAWLVEGASGLRETETQLVLTDDHWLVAQTVRASAAVAIEDTDIARVQLRGAPLASWPHLMAEGTPDGTALVIAARDLSGQGFTERDVARIAELCQEGQRYLSAAREVRALVRQLSED
jgi:hypothetical protein